MLAAIWGNRAPVLGGGGLPLRMAPKSQLLSPLCTSPCHQNPTDPRPAAVSEPGCRSHGSAVTVDIRVPGEASAKMHRLRPQGACDPASPRARCEGWRGTSHGGPQVAGQCQPTPPHPTPPHPTSPHLTPPYLTSPHLNAPHLTPPTSPHITPSHLTSPHITSPHLDPGCVVAQRGTSASLNSLVLFAGRDVRPHRARRCGEAGGCGGGIGGRTKWGAGTLPSPSL